MADKPNDRIKNAPEGNDPEPKIYLLVNGEKFVRPGMETYFAGSGDTAGSGGGGNSDNRTCSCNPVGGVYCSCNKVCSCNPLCSCQGHKSCSCQSTGGGGRYCSCVPVH